MRMEDAAKALADRIGRPVIVGICLTYMLLTSLPGMGSHFRLDAMRFGAFDPLLPKMLFQLGEVIIILVLSPLAWQWTGKGKPLASLWRGLLNTVCIVLAGYALLQWPLRVIWSSPAAGPYSLAAELISVGWAVLIASLVGFAIAWGEHQEAVQREAVKQTSEAQWNLLRSQLSPHLVLNALNGLAGLVEENPPKAAHGLEDLAAVYHQLLELGDSERIPLAKERELLERYLAVEQLRLENNLQLEWQWDGALDEICVPPLLVQPLVENAIKHGINASQTGGQLVIAARKSDNCILLEVRNTGGSLRMKSSLAGAGVGIRNLRNRLKLSYGDQAKLHLQEDGLWIIATIFLPA